MKTFFKGETKKELAKKKKKLEKKLDDLWRKIIHERDEHRCQVCGVASCLNAHHIFSRNNIILRWDLDNGVLLCPSHHNFNHKLSAHKAPAEFIEWIKIHKGAEWYERLRRKASESIKIDPELILQELQSWSPSDSTE